MLKNIAIVTLAAVVIDYHFALGRSNKALRKMGDMSSYLAGMLDENGIKMDQFDIIAVETLTD